MMPQRIDKHKIPEPSGNGPARVTRRAIFAFLLVFIGAKVGFIAGWLAAGGTW